MQRNKRRLAIVKEGKMCFLEGARVEKKFN